MPLTKSALSWGLAVSARGVVSSLPICAAGVCCDFSCCDCCCGSAGGEGLCANSEDGLRANAPPRSSRFDSASVAVEAAGGAPTVPAGDVGGAARSVEALTGADGSDGRPCNDVWVGIVGGRFEDCDLNFEARP